VSIVTTEIESIHGAASEQRMVFYRCQDHLGVWHSYGPVITIDADWDADAFMPTVAEKIARRLADGEFEEAIR
jgi:hypothetical protein